jgi:cytochrome c556
MKATTMNKPLLAGVFALAALLACQQESAAPKRNPRIAEPSELAATMRTMTADMEALKAKAQAGTLTLADVESLRAAHEPIKTASPTKPEEIKESFPGFAEAYLSNLDALYDALKTQADREAQIEAFNAVIATCESCHQQHCPGPLDRIRGIKVAE